MTQTAHDQYASVWSLYYPEERFHVQDPRLDIVDVFHAFLSDEQHLRAVVSHSWDCCYVDVQRLLGLLQLDDLEAALVSRPVEVSKCMGVALSTVFRQHHPYTDPKTFTPRFYNLSQFAQYSQIKASSVGQLVSLEGHVTKVSPSRPLLKQGAFKCAKCGQTMVVVFEDGVFEPPAQCSTPRCYNKYLEFDREQVQLVDCQRVRLTECDSATLHTDEEGRIPRTVDIELRDQLVNTCIAGDLLQVTGVVKTMQLEVSRSARFSGGRGAARESGLHSLYLHAVSAVCLHSNGDRPRAAQAVVTVYRRAPSASGHPKPPVAQCGGILDNSLQGPSSSLLTGAASVEFSEEECAQIRRLALSERALPACVHALCPHIYGQELVKAGLVLALFGGGDLDGSGEEQRGSGGRGGPAPSTRQNIHVLVVGDPGLGKSQLLRAAAAFAPRGVMVTANTSTAAGLTVTVSREGMSGEVCIEAGALILADRGHCFIDELDKLTCDSTALLEAMEQQSIHIAKAGVVTMLRARASVVAAANPAQGHYNRRKSVCENLKMNAALLSRFDLIFILLDKPDQDQDSLISDHILSAYSSAVSRRVFDLEQREGLTYSQQLRRQVHMVQQRVLRGDDEVSVSASGLRRYIEYARRFVWPRLSRGAARALQKQYLTMRAGRAGRDALPVTTRHLESLIRLAQARARVDLREEVTEQDAAEVVALMQECILDGLLDDQGRIDVTRRGGLSVGKQMKALVALMQKEARQKGDSVFHRSDIEALARRLQLDKETDALIEAMRTECYVLLKGPKLYQLQAV